MTDLSHKPFILHLRSSNFLGGPERQILRYAEAEREGPYDVAIGVFCGREEGIEFANAVERSGLALVRFPAGNFSGFRALSSYFRYRRPVLLCCHGYQADILGILAARRQRIATAAFLRGWTAEDWKVRKYEALDRSVIRLADRIVCLSQTQANEPRLSAPHDRIRIVTNAISLPKNLGDIGQSKRRLRDQFGIPEQHAVIASAGRLSPEKGTQYFLQAAQLLRNRYPNVSFVIFGEGRERQRLEQMSRDLNLGDKAIFAGHRADFPELLPGVDVLVNPSLAEQSPNVVLEAMAAGVPVVATAVGSVAEIGSDSSLIVIKPGDSTILAEAIARVLDSPQLAVSLRRAGPQRIESQYSLEVQKRQLRELYSEFACSDRTQWSPRDNSLPFISVVVPIRNEGLSIGGVLRRLIEQDYPRDRYEIIVADGRSSDDTRKIVTEIAQEADVPLKLFDNPGILSSAGRNVGIKNSRGEIVTFIDGHCTIPSTHLLSQTAEIMVRTGAACLARPQPLTPPGNGFIQSLIAEVRGAPLGHGTDSTIFSMRFSGFVNPTSSGATYRREVFDKVGIYDESFDACEDLELNFRVHQSGLPSYIDPGLTIFYEPRKTLSGLFRQMVRYGRGRFRFQAKHPSARSVGQLVPPALCLFLVLTLVSIFVLRRFPIIFALGWSAYLLAIVLSSAWLGIRKGMRYAWCAPLAFWAIHFGLGYGFWIEAISKIFKHTNESSQSITDVVRG